MKCDQHFTHRINFLEDSFPETSCTEYKVSKLQNRFDINFKKNYSLYIWPVLYFDDALRYTLTRMIATNVQKTDMV